MRREHDNRCRSKSFDYCDKDDYAAEDDDVSVSTSVAFGMNSSSVADNSESDSDMSSTPNDQQDDYPSFVRPRERGIIQFEL